MVIVDIELRGTQVIVRTDDGLVFVLPRSSEPEIRLDMQLGREIDTERIESLGGQLAEEPPEEPPGRKSRQAPPPRGKIPRIPPEPEDPSEQWSAVAEALGSVVGPAADTVVDFLRTAGWTPQAIREGIDPEASRALNAARQIRDGGLDWESLEGDELRSAVREFLPAHAPDNVVEETIELLRSGEPLGTEEDPSAGAIIDFPGGRQRVDAGPRNIGPRTLDEPFDRFATVENASRIIQQRNEALEAAGAAIEGLAAVIPTTDPLTGLPITPTGGSFGSLPSSFLAERPVTSETFGRPRASSVDAIARASERNPVQYGYVIRGQDASGVPLIIANDGNPVFELDAEGFIARDGNGDPVYRTNPDGIAVTPARTLTTQTPARYQSTDRFLPVRTMSPTQIRDLQLNMVRGGLGPEKPGQFGTWTPAWASAFEDVLGYANITGLPTWQDALSELSDSFATNIRHELSTIREESRQQVLADIGAFRPPSPEAIREDIRAAVANRLNGRSPTAEELSYFTGIANDAFRAEYDATRRARLAQAGAAISSPLEAIPEEFRSPEDVAAIESFNSSVEAEFGAVGEIPDIDPAAALDRAFRERFQGSLDLIEARDVAGDVQERTAGNASVLRDRLRRGAF